MPRLAVNGSDLYFRDEGRGEPIIFGHSSAGSGGQWRSAIERLASDYRCLAPDHLGYGRTTPYSGKGSLLEQEVALIDALLNLVDEPCHFVGHSFGGALLTRAAVLRPDRVKSLTVIEPILFHLLESYGRHAEFAEIKAISARAVEFVRRGDSEQAARGFIDYWSGPGAFDTMPAERQTATVNVMAKVGFEWEIAFSPAGASASELATLACPLQLIGGSDTKVPTAAVLQILREIWPAAGYSKISGAGHMAPITHADEVNAIIAGFLASS